MPKRKVLLFLVMAVVIFIVYYVTIIFNYGNYVPKDNLKGGESEQKLGELERWQPL